MKRGRELESKVKQAVEKKLHMKTSDSGLWLKSEIPIFGASPDGIGPRKEFCVEIKCPETKQTDKKYAVNGQWCHSWQEVLRSVSASDAFYKS